MELISSYGPAIIMLVALHLSAAMSPGPSVILVAHTSAFVSRRAGLIAALAMGFGALFWAIAALFGLHLIFSNNPYVFNVFKFIGAAFLIWTGYKMVRHSKAEDSNQSLLLKEKVFIKALKFQLMNPKVVVFFGSVYLAVFPSDVPLSLKFLILFIIFLDETLWYSLLAFGFSYSFIQEKFKMWKVYISVVCGLMLAVLGLSLIMEINL